MPHHEESDLPVDGIGTHEIGNRTYIVANVEPLDVDGTRTVALGTAAWVVALVVLLLLRHRLAAAGTDWWLWTCVAGIVLGLVGLGYCHARRLRRRRGRTPRR